MDLIIDIGGTNTRLAAVQNGQLSSPQVFPTPADPSRAIQAIAATVQQTEKGAVDRIVAAVPGVLAADRVSLAWSPNLPRWENQPLAGSLASRLGAPTTLVNDADLAGLGEAIFGAGQGHHIVAYLTISTGIGGSRIVDGRIDAAVHGFEPGHQILDADGTLQPRTPAPTTLEHLIGGASTQQREGRRPQDIKDASLWENYARYLALGLTNVIFFWSPHVIVLGGPMMRDIKREQAARHLQEILPPGVTAPPLLAALLENDTRALRGGLAYLQQA